MRPKHTTKELYEFANKLNWRFSFAKESDVFPNAVSGSPDLPVSSWGAWQDPFRTNFSNYVGGQAKKEQNFREVVEAVTKNNCYKDLPPEWRNALKLYAATFPLAEFAATIGNLRATRFGKDSAWRMATCFGALDEIRHTQIPLLLMHEFVKHDEQFDWTLKFYHSNNWVAIAARHLVDELLLTSNPIEFAVATNFVFETGFTNLQFVGLSALARQVKDKAFEKMITSIQSDETRHAQIGPAVLETVVTADKAYAQHLVDKWFWRSWQLFAVVTGFSMDYLTPLEKRTLSFKEFVEEWVSGQFLKSLERYGLEKPSYWPIFLESVENYHHMLYASAYSYRSTVWFDFVVPGPKERRWLQEKYPNSWSMYDPIWQRISSGWETVDRGNDFAVHGTAIVTFCALCQLVLCGGTPKHNSSCSHVLGGEVYQFCSEPCRKIFFEENSRYLDHKDIVKRVLKGELPANVVALIRNVFGLDYETWGKDVHGGRYPWLKPKEKRKRRSP